VFQGFESLKVTTSAGRLHVRRAGKGRPLLLLHGYPQTHAMWHRVAPALAETHEVIVPDLPGYGASEGPAFAPDHAPHSKRAYARAMVEAMAALGHEKFMLAGHDRGARVSYRLALDHPGRVAKLCCLDIVPTATNWERADARFAVGTFHWGFLAQPAPFPETMIAGAPDVFVGYCLDKWAGYPQRFDPRAREAYLEAFRRPDVIAASCEDYRAGATLDAQHDRADRAAGRKIACPVLLLWGKLSFGEDAEAMLGPWRDYADNPQGAALDAGHFVAEEAPEEVLAHLKEFLQST
jgi:haloacetate dehalogenase